MKADIEQSLNNEVVFVGREFFGFFYISVSTKPPGVHMFTAEKHDGPANQV